MLPVLAFSQKKKNKCNEGCAPNVSIYLVSNDSVQEISYLRRNTENRVMINLVGGIENVKHAVKVTSKNAIITPVPGAENEYLVTPQQDICEIIVDVKTFEDYYIVRREQVEGKEVKKVVDIYPPKTYMIGYERIEVR